MLILSLNFNTCTFTACSFFHCSLIIHLFCTYTCSQRMSLGFKRHWLKLLITKIRKIWLYLAAIRSIVRRHLCACFHIFCLYMYVYMYTHTTSIYVCVHKHIDVPIYIYLCMCAFTYTYERKIVHKYAAPSSNTDQRNYTWNIVSYDAWSMFEFIKEAFLHGIFF